MTSADDTPIVDTITNRLSDLLARAHTVKDSTSIEPPLQLLDFEKDVAQISQRQSGAPNGVAQSSPSVPPQHAALETAAKNIFYECLARCSIEGPDFVAIWNLLDILQFCANYNQCDPCLALWLIEELLDSQTIECCRRVFDYLESRRERLMTSVSRKNKEMIILRSCNELLRRLSRAEDAVFCGRVFIFLFQSFPLGDKSSVNLRGEFHVENVTTFDEIRPKDAEQTNGETMDVDEETKRDAEDAKAEEDEMEDVKASDEQPADKVDGDATQPTETQDKMQLDSAAGAVSGTEEEMDTDTLYTTFWSLQHVFSNPPKIFNQDEFETFKKGLDVAIEKFKSVPKVIPHGTVKESPGGARGTKRKRSEEDEFASNFNPKYLTSRDLFELQLSDLTFQRHVLVQALILIDFLLSLTPKAKKPLTDIKAQKAMLYSYTLSEEDTKWATSTRERIATYLQMPPDGKFYHRMISTILSRDKNWVRWKLLSCPPISLPPVPAGSGDAPAPSSFVAARGSAKRAFASKRLRPAVIGALDLGFLSDKEHSQTAFEQLRATEASADPPADTLLSGIANAELDLDMLSPAPPRRKVRTDEEREAGKAPAPKPYDPDEQERAALTEQRAANSWRLLRATARRRLALLQKVDEADVKSLRRLGANPPPDDEAQMPPQADGAAAAVPEIRIDDDAGAAEELSSGKAPADNDDDGDDAAVLSAPAEVAEPDQDAGKDAEMDNGAPADAVQADSKRDSAGDESERVADDEDGGAAADNAEADSDADGGAEADDAAAAAAGDEGQEADGADAEMSDAAPRAAHAAADERADGHGDGDGWRDVDGKGEAEAEADAEAEAKEAAEAEARDEADADGDD